MNNTHAVSNFQVVLSSLVWNVLQLQNFYEPYFDDQSAHILSTPLCTAVSHHFKTRVNYCLQNTYELKDPFYSVGAKQGNIAIKELIIFYIIL